MMFKKDFAWGAATSSHQIEGAAFEDGKGVSIWDEHVHNSGKVIDESTADVGPDHYHRVEEDVAYMKELGLKAYRFSISWPRLLPEGTGEVNEKGIAFYNKLIDALLENGIEPYITLYHWDLPAALMAKGGWSNRDITDAFAEYAALVARSYGDRVKHFITFNEPSVFLGGIINGGHAPGLMMTARYVALAHHNVLLAHGKAFRAMKAISPELLIGPAPCMMPLIPKTEGDVEACRERFFSVTHPASPKVHPLKRLISDPASFLDPIVFGTYPEDVLEKIEAYLPATWREDLEIIHTPVDFIGENVYQGKPCTVDESGVLVTLPRVPGRPRTAFKWPIEPECIYWGAKFITERYHKPLYFTENGISCHDWIMLDGKVHDPNRIDYTHRHLRMLKKALEDGMDIRGYFHWSLMDNFEWNEGYEQRFGLIYVDVPTGKRTPKDSFYWYKDVIASNGKDL